MRFHDRQDAGRRLATRLRDLADERPVVVGLARGGIPVAHEVARALDAPLDVLVVRKIGCPWQPELGVGALGEGGIRLLNRTLMAELGVTEASLDEVVRREEEELRARLDRYRGDRAPVPVTGRTVIVVDDGLATGFTARAAVEVLRHRGARRIVLAVPVGPSDTLAELGDLADEVVCLHVPTVLRAIGLFYDDFTQTTDAVVARLLAEYEHVDDGGGAAARGARSDGDRTEQVAIPLDEGGELPGTLHVPAGAGAIVLFAHGSGSSRTSPRNRAVAATLQRAGLATLLFDLLRRSEEGDRERVFDIELLAERLVASTRWVRARPDLAPLRVGYVGSSTGAAAALVAAGDLGEEIGAVVSRGGRPDLADGSLLRVSAPTLLIVGSRDHDVLELNRRAQLLLACETELAIVSGATHLFEEPGALEEVADLAADWFTEHLGA